MNTKFQNLFLSSALLILSSCNGGGSGTSFGIAQEPTPTPPTIPETPTVERAVCASSVIDSGMKGATTLRGSISDVANNPLTNFPATAYFDNSSLVIKLSYWNGQKYVHETIAGAPAVNNISLKILPSGIPVLAWTNGGVNVFLASRSDTLSTEIATWNTRALVNTAVASRAVRLDVTPTGMVGGAYLTDTAVTGKPRLILCQSQCQDLSNYQTMTVANNIGNEATNILAAQISVGFAWCGANTTGDAQVDAYYPVVTYSRAASARVTTCPNATTANCLTGASWTSNAQYINQSVLNSALQINSSVGNDSIKIAALKPAVGIKTYVSGTYTTPVSCHSLLSATTFDESTQTIGAATSGDVWLNFLRDSVGKFHLVLNSAATAVHYFNSATANISDMDGAAFWNAAHIMNTSAATALARQGGAAMNASNELYSTHFLNIAATKFNLIMNYLPVTSVSSALSVSQNSFVNTEGHLELAASNTSNIALAESSSGVMGVAYVDFSAGARNTGILKYSYRKTDELDSEWEVVTINGTTGAMSPDLKYDHLSRPWISFYDDVSSRFYLTTNSDISGSGTWQFFVFPATPTGAAVLPGSPDTSLIMNEVAGIKNPVMVILDNVNTGSKGVKSALFTSNTSAWSQLKVIDNLGAGTASSLSVAVHEQQIVISYLDRTAGVTNFVKYSSSLDGGQNYSSPLVIGTVAGAGQGIKASINPLTLSPLIVYQDRANNRLYQASCSGSVSGCQATGWSTAVLDFATGLSTLTNTATGTEGLISTATTFKADGSYEIFYAKGPANSGNLERTKMGVDGNIISSAAYYQSKASGLSSVAGHNFGVAGYHVSTILNSDEQLVAAFVGPGNKLYQKSCDTLRE